MAKGEELGGITITDDNRKETTGSKSKYDVAAHGNIIFTDKLVPEKAGNRSDLHHTYLSMGDEFNKFAAVNIVGLSANSDEIPLRNKSNIVLVDQVASSTSNNREDLVEPGTIYIRKGYMEVKGNAFKTKSNNDAKSGNGVLVASRFVANNPDNEGPSSTSISALYGAAVPDLVSDENKKLYGISAENRYDTYMVNPAYTSVMHDIKLTTRGGARLSDVLPDFINKGIYVVTNTYQEVTNDSLTYKNWPRANTAGQIRFTGGSTYTPIQKINRGQTWASPFLGVVPAPQCPPGYGRVITLNPASFEMGIAGQLKQVNGGRYYVSPTTLNSSDDLKASVNKEAEFVQATAQGTNSASMYIEGRLGSAGQVKGTVNVSNLNGIKTSEYVLSSNNSKLKPLVIQQSTYLKSQINPISSGTKNYTRGWATIMGFLYYDKNYQAFRDSSTASNKSGYSWNIFPVIPGTLEGYATVYCYFNRTNMGLAIDPDTKEKIKEFKEGYGTFIDNRSYMVDMDLNKVPRSYSKTSGGDSQFYKARLNDPELKYNEVW